MVITPNTLLWKVSLTCSGLDSLDMEFPWKQTKRNGSLVEQCSTQVFTEGTICHYNVCMYYMWLIIMHFRHKKPSSTEWVICSSSMRRTTIKAFMSWIYISNFCFPLHQQRSLHFWLWQHCDNIVAMLSFMLARHCKTVVSKSLGNIRLSLLHIITT